jgi:hypothetical protein
MGWECSTHPEISTSYKILVKKPERKRSTNIEWVLKEILCEGVAWLNQVQ